MNYDVVPYRKHYRGMGRLLLATDLYTKQTKNIFDYLLNMYYEYLENIQLHSSKDGLLKLIGFCSEISSYGIECEVIVYDIVPLANAFGYELDFLGIDIVHEMSESLLCECIDNEVARFLNDNGLCNSELNISHIITVLDHGDVKWEPCYVYKVKY